MSFRLKINSKVDQKLLQNFPDDPYADITIITLSQKLHLSLAYLSIDSDYFAGLPPGTTEVDLSNLSQQRLIFVLRALYGGQLQSNSMSELQQYYRIIGTLQIVEYKQNIAKAIKTQHQLRKDNSPYNSIDLIEFCLSNQMLESEITQHLFNNKLKILEISKNYLQLGKLTPNTLNLILMGYQQRVGEEAEVVINHIMENYFNRKSIRPADYLQAETLQSLRNIWEKYHHKISGRNTKIDKIPSIAELTKTISSNYPTLNTPDIKFNKNQSTLCINFKQKELSKSQKISEDFQLENRIESLEKELDIKCRRIQTLKEELKELMQIKEQLKKGTAASLPSIPISSSIQDVEMFKAMLKSRKAKEQSQYKSDASVEPAFQNIKKPSKDDKGKEQKITKEDKKGKQERLSNEQKVKEERPNKQERHKQGIKEERQGRQVKLKLVSKHSVSRNRFN